MSFSFPACIEFLLCVRVLMLVCSSYICVQLVGFEYIGNEVFTTAPVGDW